jgi:hypothetical protein
MPPVIALLTDFGLSDAYVAQMKGVLAGQCPDAALIDITHTVPPQDIYAGAFLLHTAVAAFPSETVFLCVVDPGVGSDRTPIALSTPHGGFVGPDNGLFSYVLADYGAPQAADGAIPPPVGPTPAPAQVQAYRITNAALFRQPVSRTFHGRDIFAPVAAYLAGGGAASDVGEPVASLHAYTPPQPLRRPGGRLLARVLHADSYGNLITNLRENDLPPDGFRLRVGGRDIRGLSASYQSGEPLLAIGGSSGYVEVAARGGSAAERLGVGRWAPVLVEPA